MTIFQYDKTFEGFLSLVFESFSLKVIPNQIENLEFSEPCLWMEKYPIETDLNKSNRVWNALKTKLGHDASFSIFRVHLAGIAEMELALFRYVCKALASSQSISDNFADPDVLAIIKFDKKVCREAQRMLEFVRFQKTGDGIFFCSMDPEYNVLPLIINHFEKRFADQQWLLYDSKRNYGFYYNLENTAQVTMQLNMINKHNGKVNKDILAEEEVLFQDLWKQYFKSTSIEERKNKRLQMQHMPKRYWKYLTEKQS